MSKLIFSFIVLVTLTIVKGRPNYLGRDAKYSNENYFGHQTSTGFHRQFTQDDQAANDGSNPKGDFLGISAAARKQGANAYELSENEYQQHQKQARDFSPYNNYQSGWRSSGDNLNGGQYTQKPYTEIHYSLPNHNQQLPYDSNESFGIKKAIPVYVGHTSQEIGGKWVSNQQGNRRIHSQESNSNES